MIFILEVLKIMMIVLAVIIIISQYLLYNQHNKKINIIFIINVLLSVILSWILFTSMPTNYTMQKMISLAWGLISLSSLAQAYLKKEVQIINKVLLSIATFGGLLHWLFV